MTLAKCYLPPPLSPSLSHPLSPCDVLWWSEGPVTCLKMVRGHQRAAVLYKCSQAAAPSAHSIICCCSRKEQGSRRRSLFVRLSSQQSATSWRWELFCCCAWSSCARLLWLCPQWGPAVGSMWDQGSAWPSGTSQWMYAADTHYTCCSCTAPSGRLNMLTPSPTAQHGTAPTQFSVSQPQVSLFFFSFFLFLSFLKYSTRFVTMQFPLMSNKWEHSFSLLVLVFQSLLQFHSALCRNSAAPSALFVPSDPSLFCWLVGWFL